VFFLLAPYLRSAWRWFTGLGFDQEIPHHSTFSKNRHGRFQKSKLFEQLFEEIVRQCVEVGLVQGKHLSVQITDQQDAQQEPLGFPIAPFLDPSRLRERRRQRIGASRSKLAAARSQAAKAGCRACGLESNLISGNKNEV
jgi:hypothetical protein